MNRFANNPRRTIPLIVALAALVVAWPFTGATALGQTDDAQAELKELGSIYSDFLHFARLGKFTEAESFAQQLLNHPDASPLNVLKVSDADANSVPTLIQLIKHTSLSDEAQSILDLIRAGEFERRKDPERIAENIDKLGGSPQMEFFAIQRLKEAGEYAVPQMIEALQNPERKAIWPRLIRALPQIGKPAVNPLVQALATDNNELRRQVIWALGEIGYPQAVPYLLRTLNEAELSQQTRADIEQALDSIRATTDRTGPESAVASFIELANRYYNEHDSVAADPRIPSANVWYWQEGRLTAVEVPTEIFGPVMAMRTSEEALLLDAKQQNAIALWLAANFRREARLGMDVESTEPDAGADADATRPDDFPRSIYFARAAGPLYCHMVLGRAVNDQDKPVALGAIAALDVVAGSSTLVGAEDYKQPLVQALRFPDAEVRYKAAIAIARALPQRSFAGADLASTVLAQALQHGGQAQYVVVDADRDNLNRVAGALRSTGAMVVADTGFLAALDQARGQLQNVNAFFVGTNIETPNVLAAVEDLRKNYRYSRVPVIVLSYAQQEFRAEQTANSYAAIQVVDANASADEMLQAVDTAAQEVGVGPLSPELAVELAQRAAEALRLVAIDNDTVIDFAPAIPALIAVLREGDDEPLRITAAHVLALATTGAAQQAIADTALDETESMELRIAGFDTLAESARRNGNMLTQQQVQEVVEAAAASDADLTLRTAASQALGALNLRMNEASAIIRAHHRG